MKDSLVHSLVNSGDGCGVGSAGLGLVTGSDSGVELLDGGLQSGLGHLVLLVGGTGQRNSLLRGLDVGHGCTSSYGDGI